MPIIRKITYVGVAKGISLPKSWLDRLKHEYGVNEIIPLFSNQVDFDLEVASKNREVYEYEKEFERMVIKWVNSC